MTYNKKLIEVALPLKAINIACAREMSAGSDAGAEKETPPQGRRRAGDAISGGADSQNHAGNRGIRQEP